MASRNRSKAPSRAARPLVIEPVAIDLLRPDPSNPRRIADAELDSLTACIHEYGVVQPVLARRADATIIAGHQRIVAARRLGHDSVPVIWVDVSGPKARLLGLALNRISGEWDPELLGRMVADLNAIPDIDLAISGFREDEIATLLRSLEVRDKRDRLETFDLETSFGLATREPRTKHGDLWRLGDHNLLCGDATKAEHFERVLMGKPAALAFTDPPYNVNLGNHGGHPRATRRRTIANDALDPAAWDTFVRAWAPSLLRSTDGAIYVCMSSKEWPTLTHILAELGGHWSDTIIWAKDQFVVGRADYQRAYEAIWYGWREGAKHHWCGDRDQSDVWQIPRPGEAPLAPVMKPLGLMERAIGNSSHAGDVVLDPFAGSGSTLIACERTGRRCAAIELDPVYVDVVVARWERFTGEHAVVAED
jgi:DNA modification methylase